MRIQTNDISCESEKCIRCGYDLYGIAAAHACPECGLERDPHALVIYGFGESATAEGCRSAARLFLKIAFVLVFVGPVIAIGQELLGIPQPIAFAGVIVGSIVVLLVIGHLAQRDRARRGILQLNITADGVFVYTGRPSPPLLRWREFHVFHFTEVNAKQWCIILRHRKAVHEQSPEIMNAGCRAHTIRPFIRLYVEADNDRAEVIRATVRAHLNRHSSR